MSGTAAAPSPSWADESLAVVAARRRLAGAVVLVLGLVAIVVTLVAPGVLPPNALVGAAVAIAALLLGVAAVLAVDAADLVVRGVRHVHAAGAQVAATVSPDAEDVHALQAIVGRRARGGRVRIGVVAASRSAGAPGARAAALAETLARTGKRVLLTDLTRGASGNAGLSDVIAGTHRLRDVVHFDEGIYLGRVAVGTDKQVALAGYDDWVTHLPSDLEVLVTVLPPLADPQVLDATVGMDVVFLQVEIDRTERVDLLASLDALDAVDQSCEIVLVDPTRGSSRTGVAPVADEPSSGGETSDEDGPTDDDRPAEDTAGADRAVTDSAPDDPGPDEAAPDRGADESDEAGADTSTAAVPGTVGAARAATAAGTTASPERDRWTSEDVSTPDATGDATSGTDAGPAAASADPATPVTDAATADAADTVSADEESVAAVSPADGDDAASEAEGRETFVRPLGATPPPRGNALPDELLPDSTSGDSVDHDDHDDDPDATRELPRIERPDAVPATAQDDEPVTAEPSAARQADVEPVAAEPAPAPPVTSDRDEQGDDGGDRWLDPRAVWSDLPTRPTAGSDAEGQSDDATADADLVDIGDDVTGEAVRTAAALQALAQQVWSRED